MKIKGYICQKCEWSDISAIDKCPRCRGTVKETSFSDRGRVVTFTLIRYPPLGFEKEAPYVIGLIDIEMGPRVVARIAAKPEQIQVGKIVSLVRSDNGLLEFRLQM